MAGKTTITIETRPPFRDTQGRFAAASEAAKRRARDEMRGTLRLLVGYLQEEVPKRSGKTAAGIRFQTQEAGNRVEGRVTMPQPVSSYLEKGTGIYGPRGGLIYPVSARVLRFEIGSRTLFRPFIRGMRPNPFISRAYRRWLPEAQRIGGRVALGFQAAVRG